MSNEIASTETGSDYVIPAENIEKLKADMAAFVKRMQGYAKRKSVQFTEPALTIGPARAIPQSKDPETEMPRPDRIVHDVHLEAEPAKVPGYEFVATLEHIDGAGTIVRVSPVAKVREQEFVFFREATAKCEHCGYDRQRKDTFIVRSEATGMLIQVGRNCLKDFFGHDPSWTVRMLEFVSSLGDLCRESSNGGMRVQTHFSLRDFLPWVVSCIRLHGWTSRTKAREFEGLTATADRAWSFAFPFGAKPQSFWVDRREHEPNEKDLALVEAALAFCREKFEDADTFKLSDYEHNLSVCVLGDVVDGRKAGIVASLVTYYNRDLAKREETQKDADSQWMGALGKREVFTLTLKKIFYAESQWGTKTIYKFKDAAGNIATWFSTATLEAELVIGVTYSVKGTVKKHEEYRGAKQTILNRCSVGVVVVPVAIVAEAQV